VVAFLTGRVFMIKQDLLNGMSVSDISLKYGVTTSAIYQVAKRYSITLPLLKNVSQEEKKAKKKIADANRYNKEKENKLNRPDIPMPQLPVVATKFGALSSLNTAWIINQGYKKTSVNDFGKTQRRYGLHTG